MGLVTEMLDPRGVSKGSGFVAFSTPRKLLELLILLKCKHLPAGYGFQPQPLPGFRPGIGPNFMVPYHLQKQGRPGQIMGLRRGGNPHLIQQHVMSRNSNQGLRYIPNSRNGLVDPSVVPLTPIMTLPLDASSVPIATVEAQRDGLVYINTLPKRNLGGGDRERGFLDAHLRREFMRLLPLTHYWPHSNHATGSPAQRKVTGMLLKMDKTEVLHLLKSPQMLSKKFQNPWPFWSELDACFEEVSYSSRFLDMFKYAISTKMEVRNLSLGGSNYSSLFFVKMDIGDIPNTKSAVLLPNE
ncbi:hypothetical protein C5167_026509 [Papaver somniferum]|nr:hypothetical protein C5167_026509 [Papaver somniferum]